jgi:membrane associated rhomboid family serine protease
MVLATEPPVKREDRLENVLEKASKLFPIVLLTVAIVALIYLPLVNLFLFLCAFLIVYPLFALKKGTFKGIRIYWYSLVWILTVVFFLTIRSEQLVLDLATSWNTPWGVLTSIFIHASTAHLVSNLLGLSFFMYLYLTLMRLSAQIQPSTVASASSSGVACSTPNENLNSQPENALPEPKPPAERFTLARSSEKAKMYFIVVGSLFAAVWANLLSLPQTGTSVGASGLVYAIAGIVLVEAVKQSITAIKRRPINARFLLISVLVIAYFVLNFYSFNTFFNVAPNVSYVTHEWAFLLGIIVAVAFTVQQKFRIFSDSTPTEK